VAHSAYAPNIVIHIICGIPILGYIYDSLTTTPPVLGMPFFQYCSFRGFGCGKAMSFDDLLRRAWPRDLEAMSSHLLPGRTSSSYLQSTLLSCAAATCHLPSRFSQVSVQTWHCFAPGCVLSLPMACSLP
jgi:hypothetical protein